MQISELLKLKYINASQNRKIEDNLTTHRVLCFQTQNVNPCDGTSQ